MSEIKFRGKSKLSIEKLDTLMIAHDNGWVYGNLIHNGENPFIVGDIVEADEDYLVHEYWSVVHLDSVGQCIGMKDINDVNMYSGDIVHLTENEGEKVDFIGEIRFVNGSFYVSSCDDSFRHFRLMYYKMEVIGNVHECPELLDD